LSVNKEKKGCSRQKNSRRMKKIESPTEKLRPQATTSQKRNIQIQKQKMKLKKSGKRQRRKGEKKNWQQRKS
jgi:hypothetical protein